MAGGSVAQHPLSGSSGSERKGRAHLSHRAPYRSRATATKPLARSVTADAPGVGALAPPPHSAVMSPYGLGCAGGRVATTSATPAWCASATLAACMPLTAACVEATCLALYSKTRVLRRLKSAAKALPSR